MADGLLVVAGEASGDLHGARLLTQLLRLQPQVDAFGLGGDELRDAGCTLIAESRDIAVVGITEVLKILPRAKKIFDQLLAEVDRRGTQLALLIDAPDFNLRLAKQLKRRGVRVVYYISPQIWAWRRRRVHQIARRVDEMLVLFPFEVEFYRRHDIAVQHVGHPLLDEVTPRPQVWDSEPDTRLEDSAPLHIVLLPGSRPSEIRKLLQPMLGAVDLLAQRLPIQVSLVEAPALDSELFDAELAAVDVPVRRVRQDRFDTIAAAHLVLCASGTATLEVGLLGTPMVVIYRLNQLSYWLGRWLVDLPNFSLVNLVLQEEVVPELLQDATEPPRLAATMQTLLSERDKIAAMREALQRLRSLLGPSGASRRAAEAVAVHVEALRREAGA